MKSIRYWARGLLVSGGTILLLAALVLVAEGFMRLFDLGSHIGQHDVRANIEMALPCFRQDGAGTQRRLIRNPTADDPERSQEYPLEKAAGAARIAIVGESTSVILGDPLRERLEQASCPQKYEVFACGVHGSALETTELRFNEMLEYKPDAIIVMFAHNFRERFHRPEPSIRALLQRLIKEPSLHFLLDSRVLFSLLGSINVDRGPGSGPIAPSLAESEKYREATEAALVRMTDRAQALHVPVVLTTMGENLLSPPWNGSDPAPDTALLDARLARATRGGEAGVGILDVAFRSSPRASLAYQKGVWLLEDGHPDQAREAFFQAIEHDTLTPRAPRSLNEFIRQLGLSRRATVWDAERATREAASNGIPAWDGYSDADHPWGPAAERTMAAVVAMAEEEAHLAPCPFPPRTLMTPTPYKFLNLGGRQFHTPDHDLERDWATAIQIGLVNTLRQAPELTDRKVEDFFGGQTWAAQLAEDRAITLDGLAWGYWESGRRDRAWELNTRAREIPGNDRAEIQRAFWLLSQGKGADAQQALKHAVEMKPNSDAVHLLKRVEEEQRTTESGH